MAFRKFHIRMFAGDKANGVGYQWNRNKIWFIEITRVQSKPSNKVAVAYRWLRFLGTKETDVLDPQFTNWISLMQNSLIKEQATFNSTAYSAGGGGGGVCKVKNNQIRGNFEALPVQPTKKAWNSQHKTIEKDQARDRKLSAFAIHIDSQRQKLQ